MFCFVWYVRSQEYLETRALNLVILLFLLVAVLQNIAFSFFTLYGDKLEKVQELKRAVKFLVFGCEVLCCGFEFRIFATVTKF